MKELVFDEAHACALFDELAARLEVSGSFAELLHRDVRDVVDELCAGRGIEFSPRSDLPARGASEIRLQVSGLALRLLEALRASQGDLARHEANLSPQSSACKGSWIKRWMPRIEVE